MIFMLLSNKLQTVESFLNSHLNGAKFVFEGLTVELSISGCVHEKIAESPPANAKQLILPFLLCLALVPTGQQSFSKKAHSL